MRTSCKQKSWMENPWSMTIVRTFGPVKPDEISNWNKDAEEPTVKPVAQTFRYLRPPDIVGWLERILSKHRGRDIGCSPENPSMGTSLNGKSIKTIWHQTLNKFKILYHVMTKPARSLYMVQLASTNRDLGCQSHFLIVTADHQITVLQKFSNFSRKLKKY